MRIIAGIAKGSIIKTPKGVKTRPTADRVRESIFNIIQFDIQNKRVLDLFAGSGALGIEALSRGAKKVVFVDEWQDAIKCITENVNNLSFSEQGEIVKMDYRKALTHLAQKNDGLAEFDFIFLDPPYNKGIIEIAINQISNLNLLANDGYIIVETSSKETLPVSFNDFNCARTAKYGDTKIWFYTFKGGI